MFPDMTTRSYTLGHAADQTRYVRIYSAVCKLPTPEATSLPGASACQKDRMHGMQGWNKGAEWFEPLGGSYYRSFTAASDAEAKVRP